MHKFWWVYKMNPSVGQYKTVGRATSRERAKSFVQGLEREGLRRTITWRDNSTYSMTNERSERTSRSYPSAIYQLGLSERSAV